MIPLDKYRHIAFDLDGTLVHTVPEYRHRVVPMVVSALGGTVRDTRAVDRFWFESGRDEIIKNEFGLAPAAFWTLFRATDSAAERTLATVAYADAERALRRLKEMDKVISIITGAPHWIARMEIAKLNGAPHDFYLSITSSKFSEKPNPTSLYYALGELAVEPRETLYIGNSNEDAYYAKNAGVDFMYLERKEHQFDLKDYAVSTIRSLDELFAKLMRA